jgi:hypothetical protein
MEVRLREPSEKTRTELFMPLCKEVPFRAIVTAIPAS